MIFKMRFHFRTTLSLWVRIKFELDLYYNRYSSITILILSQKSNLSLIWWVLNHQIQFFNYGKSVFYLIHWFCNYQTGSFSKFFLSSFTNKSYKVKSAFKLVLCIFLVIQSNLCTTATPGTWKKRLLDRGAW
jgi:hypothetical protein